MRKERITREEARRRAEMTTQILNKVANWLLVAAAALIIYHSIDKWVS